MTSVKTYRFKKNHKPNTIVSVDIFIEFPWKAADGVFIIGLPRIIFSNVLSRHRAATPESASFVTITVSESKNALLLDRN